MITGFDLDRTSPYMLLVAPVQSARRSKIPENYSDLSVQEQLNTIRSDIQAVTHVDFSSRIQSVSKHTNEKFWNLINTFKRKTGYGLLVNTSFNIRGEPIVCSPEDAYTCFMKTGIDFLVMNNFIFDKKQQPQIHC
jgi:carbamoyltransferase